MTLHSDSRPDCRFCKGSGMVSVSKDPDEVAECACIDPVDRAVIEQIAMFRQKHDAIRHSTTTAEGVSHPTWGELGPDARGEYLADAELTVRAMVALGWRPRRV